MVCYILKLDRTPEELLQKHLEAYNANALIPNPEIDSLITKLQRNYLIACLTNTEPEIGESNRRNGIFDRFKPYDFLSNELRLRKPMPEIYIKVLRRINSKPSETVFIDDNSSYIQGARSVGLHTVHYNNSDQLKKELFRMGIFF